MSFVGLARVFVLVTILSAMVALSSCRHSRARVFQAHSQSRQLQHSQLLDELQYLFNSGADQQLSYGPAALGQVDTKLGQNASHPSLQLLPSDAFSPAYPELSDLVGDTDPDQVRLDQILSGLDQLAALLPAGQDASAVSEAGLSYGLRPNTQPPNVPIIDPGLFVIQGVRTCGNQSGYCMLGNNCSADSDFSADPAGHCAGLRTAFSPPADFVCCQFDAVGRTASPATRTTPTTTEGTTFDDGVADALVSLDGPSSSAPPREQLDENSQIVDIVAIITDTTGIVDIVTRPYTGPWPPREQDHVDAAGVTLPFAKPGQTFNPDELAGLGGEQGRNGITTPLPETSTRDQYQAADLLESSASVELVTDEHLKSNVSASNVDLLVTLAPSTEATSFASTESVAAAGIGAAQYQLSEAADHQDLGPLADVPLVDPDQDYIGDVDYDQHLLPALVPQRFTAFGHGQIFYSNVGEGSGGWSPSSSADSLSAESRQDVDEGSGFVADFSEVQTDNILVPNLTEVVELGQSELPVVYDNANSMLDHSAVETLQHQRSEQRYGVRGSSLATLLAMSGQISQRYLANDKLDPNPPKFH